MNMISMSKEAIKEYLVINFAKLYSPNSIPIGTENIRRLIKAQISNENYLLLILAIINDKLVKEDKNNRKEIIKLLPFFTQSFNDISAISISFLSKVLTVIQTQISQELSFLYGLISACFSEIIESLFLKDENIINKVDTDPNINNIYELMQGFCIYNIKQEDKSCNIVGGLCLNVLIQACPLVLQGCYLNYLWKNIIFYLEKDKYNGKIEILNSLISLIFACEDSFSPYASKTLNVVLDFLSDEDWLRRKLSLNIIFALCTYCINDIQTIKDQIVNCLKVLKNDKAKEVREVSIQTLKILNEAFTSEVIQPNEVYSKKPIKKDDLSPKNDNLHKQNKSIDNLKQETKQVLNSINQISAQFQDKRENYHKIDKEQLKENNNIDLIKAQKDNKNRKEQKGRNVNIKKSMTPDRTNITKSRDKSFDNQKVEKEQIKKEKTKFINNKMNLKRDPNYSIFKTKANLTFFDNNTFEGNDIKIKFIDKKEQELIEDDRELIEDNKILDENFKPNEIKEKYILINSHRESVSSTPKKERKEENEVTKTKLSPNKNLLNNRILEISEKQLELIERLSNLENKQIEDLNYFISKITTLESTISIFNLSQKGVNNQNDSKEKVSNLSIVLNLIKKNQINEATEISLSTINTEEHIFFNFLSKLNQINIKELNQENLSKIVNEIIEKLRRGEYIQVIIQFLKLVLLGNSQEIQLSQDHLDGLYSSIDLIINNKLKYNINDDIIADLMLIKKEDQIDSLINDFNN